MQSFFRRNLEVPAGLRVPPHGTFVATWLPGRNGWAYSDYTNDWKGYGLGQCIRLFRRMIPYSGTEIGVLTHNGLIWSYKWQHTTRWQAHGAYGSGCWTKEAVRTTGHVYRRCRWLRMLGIHWRLV